MRTHQSVNAQADLSVYCKPHCILVDSSTVVCWMSTFVILGASSLFCCYYSIFDGKSC